MSTKRGGGAGQEEWKGCGKEGGMGLFLETLMRLWRGQD